MKTWQGEAIWKDERETTTVSVSINPYGLSILKAGKEFFFTKDEFRVVEASESGYVKLEVERASLKAFVEIESAEAFQTIKEDKFDKNRKPLLSVSSWIIVGFVGIVIVVVLFFTTGANFLFERNRQTHSR